MTDFTIRPATDHDLDALWRIVRAAVQKMNAEGSDQWGDDYPTRAIYAADISSEELWVAAGPQGAILGVAYISDKADPAYAAIPWSCPDPAIALHRIAVDPTLQRSGVASAFFAHAEVLAQAQHISSLRIDTYSKNTGMQALLLGRGFTPMGEMRLHHRPHPFLCFEKPLSPCLLSAKRI